MKTISLTILILGFLAVCHNQAVAQNVVPPGSYQKTCENFKVSLGTVLYANCNNKSSVVVGQSQIMDFHICDADIWNDNGTLKCNKNPNLPIYQKGLKAINDGYMDVFGVSAEKPEKNLSAMIEQGYRQQYFAGNLDSTLSVAYLKGALAYPSNGYDSTRIQVIDRAMWKVYGRKAFPADFDYWKPRILNSGAYYKTIIIDETTKLSKDSAARKLMIVQAYKNSMGRPASQQELNYWVPKPENYSQLLDASRNWLYSDGGAVDLRETAKRAYAANNGKEPNAGELDGMVNLLKATKQNLIYQEMVK